jgi:hypothetical protein
MKYVVRDSETKAILYSSKNKTRMLNFMLCFEATYKNRTIEWLTLKF